MDRDYYFPVRNRSCILKRTNRHLPTERQVNVVIINIVVDCIPNCQTYTIFKKAETNLPKARVGIKKYPGNSVLSLMDVSSMLS